MDKTKVPIELKPYNAMSILAFCREFINDRDLPENDYKFQAIREAVDEFEMQIHRNLTMEQLEEIRFENKTNQLIGKSPIRE